MDMISTLVFKYLICSLKKTIVAILSIAISVFFFTVISSTFSWGFNYMKEVEVSSNGSWQARYHGLDEAQAAKLKTQEEFKHCVIREGQNGVYVADIEMKEVGKRIFAMTQEIGGEIGMTTLETLEKTAYLPNSEEATYDISYHMALLDFYGISYSDNEMPLKYMLMGVLAIVMVVFSLIVYSIFSISFAEKRRYIGLLACVGATKRQRCMFVFLEGIALGILSIPLGLILGWLGSGFIIERVRLLIEVRYELQIALQASTDFRILMLAAVLGSLTIFLATTVPTLQARKISPLEMMSDQSKEKIVTSMVARYRIKRSVSFNMAIRNIVLNKGKSVNVIVFAVLAIVVAFNGFIYMRITNGYYLLQDERPYEIPDAFMSIYSDDFTMAERIKREIIRLPSVQNASYMSILDIGGITIDKAYLASDLNAFRLYGMGGSNPATFADDEQKSDIYAFQTKIIGLEDTVFDAYAKQNGVDNIQATKDTPYPVIIENYLPVLDMGRNVQQYREVLQIAEPTNLRVLFGTYGDFTIINDQIYRSETQEMMFHVLSQTQKRPPIPISPQEYAGKIGAYSQFADTDMKIYMPYSAFQDFLKEPQVIHAYGEMEQYNNPVLFREHNPIANYLFVHKTNSFTDNKIKDDFSDILNHMEVPEYKNTLPESYINNSNSWEYSTAETLKMQKILDLSNVMKKLFIISGIAVIVFFTVFSLVNYILASTQARKRELSILKSIGMGYNELRSMLIYEISILILTAGAIGTLAGYLLAMNQFYEYKQRAVAEITMPHWVMLIEILVVLILVLGITISAIQKIKQVNIIDALKSEHE